MSQKEESESRGVHIPLFFWFGLLAADQPFLFVWSATEGMEWQYVEPYGNKFSLSHWKKKIGRRLEEFIIFTGGGHKAT